MFNVVKNRNWFFGLSLLLIIPGIISIILWGLDLGVDFTGGTLLEVQFKAPVSREQIVTSAHKKAIDVVSLQTTTQNAYSIRTKTLTETQAKDLLTEFSTDFPGASQISRETVGPTIGQELLSKSLRALLVAAVMIVIYVAWAFRKVPKPMSSWRFGVTAIVALLHDVVILIGVFSLLGHFFAVEVDSLFVTAVLTVIGFSVHDTIVVFDRIRENLHRNAYKTFEETVNNSIMQTLNRSINTSLTVILVLLALLLFGGSSIRWFVVALLIGIISGTYSSIFNASPLLVVWQNFSDRRKKKS